jgi:hypothetical protein
MRIVSLAASDTKIEELLPQDESITMSAVAGQLSSIKNSRTHEAKQIKAFTFDGRTYEIGHWEEELLTTLCNHFANIHPKEFEKVL